MISAIFTWFLARPWWETAFLVVTICLLGALLAAVLLTYLVDLYHRRRDPMHGRCEICGDDLTVFKNGCDQADCPYFNRGDRS